MVNVTSARPSGGRPAVPAKITSSILPPRSALAPCSPSTHEMASTTLDLPEPFGPTTQVMPGSSRIVVAEAKDLKPLTVRLLRCTDLRGSRGRMPPRRVPAVRAAFGFGARDRFTPDMAARRHKRCGRRAVCDATRGVEPVGAGWAPRRSGQCRLGQPQQIVVVRGSRRSQPIVLRPEAGDLELQVLH